MYQMLTRLFPLLLLCAVAAILSSCGQSRERPLRITENDAGSTVKLQQRQILEVALQGNPTTGYTWEVVPGAESVLKQQSEPQFDAESKALGSGGRVTLRFEAVGQGEAALGLIYHRTFEPGVAPLDTFEVKVVVRP
jgi:inhibitor of cysteine peptidase